MSRTQRQRNALRNTRSTRVESSITKGFRAPSIINQSNIDLEKNEKALLKLGPQYIPNNPHLAHKRMTNEIELVVKKINKTFIEHGWVLPQQRVQIFIDSLEKILTDCHDKHPPSTQLKDINNLRMKFEMSQTVIRKTDKSKVFHLGKLDDYKEKTRMYMNKTQAYQDLGPTNPLETLVECTNSFLYGLWYNKHLSQIQYERLKVKKGEAELAHLYFLPKAHKANTPLRPIMSGLKSPTIAISKWLDGLLRPLFNRLAYETSILNGVQLLKQVKRWSTQYLTSTTSFITMDVTDLYTMIPQEGEVTAIKKLIEACGLKQIDGVKKEIILSLTRFVMTNNYFYLDGTYYKQIRGGAMGSSLTLTIANAYMYFVERPISKWANRTSSLYYRYIDDLFIMSNVHADILKGLVKFWNRLDKNIELTESIGQTAEYLDTFLVNNNGHLMSEVFHKPSHEPYFLPYTSIHPLHIKKNIPFVAFIRAIRYSSNYDAFKCEEAHICMSLLLNKYPQEFILRQFERVLQTFQCAVLTRKNYCNIRQIFLDAANNNKTGIDFEVNILCHFSYCKGMHDFPTRFHKLWNDCFADTAICNMKPIVGSKKLDNLQNYLVRKKPNKSVLRIST